MPRNGEAQADWNLTRTYYFRGFFQVFGLVPRILSVQRWTSFDL